MGAGAAGIQCHAGIVKEDETLTKRAIDLFIEDVKKELELGSDGFVPAFPCGPNVPPNPDAYLLDLENEKKFPDFHKTIIHGHYEKIAAALNVAGGFTILPICDPLALAFALGIDVDLKIDFPDGFLEYLIPNLPKLAIDLKLMPPVKLAAKFPGLLTIPPELPSPPALPLPTFDPKLKLKVDLALALEPGLIPDLAIPLKIPELLLKLIAKIPGLILDLPNLPGAICKIIFEAGLFSITPEATVKIVSYKVLLRKISEMLMLVAVGKVIGSAPAGVTGGLGVKLGYAPPVTPTTEQSTSVRDNVVQYATECVDLSWGDNSVRDEFGTTQEQYAQRLLYTEYGDGTPKNTLDSSDAAYDARVLGRDETVAKTSTLSSCGMLARACCFAGGARYAFKYAGQPLLNKNQKINRYYDFFSDEYRLINGSGIAISGLLQAAKTKDAEIHISTGDLPALLKGDVIVVYDPNVAGREHVMIVAEDYSQGSFELTTIEGGQPDPNNEGRPTAIRKKTYKDPSSDEFTNKASTTDSPFSFKVTSSGNVELSGRRILKLIDVEKLCTNGDGASTANPSEVLDPDVFDNNDPSSDAANGLLDTDAPPPAAIVPEV